MKTLIFADVHLKVHAEGGETYEEFVSFLRSIDPAEFGRVVMLGDLFDFWFEYRQVIFSGYFDVLRALADLHDGGAELHLVCGNHDFWAGRFLEEVGVHVHPDSCVLSDGSVRVHFVHGDGVNPSDWRYRAYKRFARWPWVVGCFRLVHPDWAMALARTVSRASRRSRQRRLDNAQEVAAVRENARRILEREDVSAVISGHTHERDEAEWTLEDGRKVRYLNTGDWMEDRRYLVWEGESFESRHYAKPPATSE